MRAVVAQPAQPARRRGHVFQPVPVGAPQSGGQRRVGPEDRRPRVGAGEHLLDQPEAGAQQQRPVVGRLPGCACLRQPPAVRPGRPAEERPAEAGRFGGLRRSTGEPRARTSSATRRSRLSSAAVADTAQDPVVGQPVQQAPVFRDGDGAFLTRRDPARLDDLHRGTRFEAQVRGGEQCDEVVHLGAGSGHHPHLADRDEPAVVPAQQVGERRPQVLQARLVRLAHVVGRAGADAERRRVRVPARHVRPRRGRREQPQVQPGRVELGRLERLAQDRLQRRAHRRPPRRVAGVRERAGDRVRAQQLLAEQHVERVGASSLAKTWRAARSRQRSSWSRHARSWLRSSSAGPASCPGRRRLRAGRRAR